MSVESLNRTLDQELASLVRGASLECLVAGSSCSVSRALSPAQSAVRSSQRARNPDPRATIRGAGRVTAGLFSRPRGSPDTVGQGRWAMSSSSGATQAAKADGKWNRKETAGR